MQKTRDESKVKETRTALGCPGEGKPEAVWPVGAQSYIEIEDGILVEVIPDETHLLEYILSARNMDRAISRVVSNGGSGGVDHMPVGELRAYWAEHGGEIKKSILEGKYKPSAVRRVRIPKDNGKWRLLGIPVVVDRAIQQAIAQVLTAIYEPQFSNSSYGFRPGRGAHDAINAAKEYLNQGYEYGVGLDLERFFDTISHSYTVQLLSRTIKDGRVIGLIHKYLKAGVMEGGLVKPTEAGAPQGGPLSPCLSNVVLNELDREIERNGHPFVRYADDSLIFCRSKRAAERIAGNMTKFIEEKMHLRVNRDKTDIGYVRGMKYLGFSFTKMKLKGDPAPT